MLAEIGRLVEQNHEDGPYHNDRTNDSRNDTCLRFFCRSGEIENPMEHNDHQNAPSATVVQPREDDCSSQQP